MLSGTAHACINSPCLSAEPKTVGSLHQDPADWAHLDVEMITDHKSEAELTTRRAVCPQLVATAESPHTITQIDLISGGVLLKD